MEAGGGGQWWSWALACRETASGCCPPPQVLPRLPSARVSTIRVTLEGAGVYSQEPLLRGYIVQRVDCALTSCLDSGMKLVFNKLKVKPEEG